MLLLDEPSNGLDPDGIRWLRNYLSDFAAAGGTVFVSSHLIGELAMFADDLVVVGGGKLARRRIRRERSPHAAQSPSSSRRRTRRARRAARSPTTSSSRSSPIGCTCTAPPRPPSPRSPSITASGSIEITETTASLEDSLLDLTAAVRRVRIRLSPTAQNPKDPP